MRIAISGKGTYYAKNLLKKYNLKWVREKHAWIGDVDRLTVSLIRTSVMTYYKNLTLVFEDKAQEEEYYGWPRWICPNQNCGNIIRWEDLETKFTETQGKCPFCKQVCTLELEE